MKWIWLALPIMIVLISFQTSWTGAELEYDTDVFAGRANIAFENQRYQNAIILYDRALEIDPEHVTALINKGITLIQINQTEEGIAQIDKALEIKPNHIAALTYRGEWTVINENIDNAFSYFDRLFETEPKNLAALSYKGDYSLKNGNPDQAISYYEEVLEINPIYKGVFNKILKIDPNHLDALNAKGSSTVSLGRSESGVTVVYIDNLDEAISYFDRVLEEDPNHIGALFNKGRALIGMSYVDRILELDTNNVDAIAYKGDRLVSLENPEEALTYIDRALELEPNHMEALFNKGIIFAKQGNYNDALTIYDKIVQGQPENKLAATNLKIAVKRVGYIPLDGFLEVTVKDENGYNAVHLKIPELSVLNHTISTSMIDEWPVTKIINRDGQEYEVRQLEASAIYHIFSIRGGATHYGISYPYVEDVSRLQATYWQYLVSPEDTLTFTYTAFRPVA